jgi:uncharacterized protein YndB with AHSA1/START domain
MAPYQFVTEWQLEAPLQQVWQALLDSDKWPQWWRGVKSVRLVRQGDERGIGSVRHYVWRSKLPYDLAFDMEATEIDEPRRLAGKASGELEGTGVWDLSEADGITSVRYTWTVRTTKPWMNLLAPIARPLFEWNHDYVMANGARGLAHLLSAQLISS